MAFARSEQANLCIFCYTSIQPDNIFQENTTKVNSFCTNLSRLLYCENINESSTVSSSSSSCNSFSSCEDCERIITQFSNIYHEIKCLELKLFGKLESLGKVMSLADNLCDKKSNVHLNGLEAFRTFRNKIKEKCDVVRKLTTCQPRVSLKRLDAERDATDLNDRSDNFTFYEEEAITNDILNFGTLMTVTTAQPLEYGKITKGIKTEICTDDEIASTEYTNSATYGPSLTNEIKIEDILEKIEVDEDSNLFLQEGYEEEEEPNNQLNITSNPPPQPVALQRNGDKLFTCQQCGKSFIHKKSFRFYLEFHKTPDKWKYKCGICGKKVAIKQNLLKHMATHSTERPWKCDHPNCGKDFKTKDRLKLHMKIHLEKNSDLMKFECKICKKKFRTQYDFKRHEFTHTKIRAYKCETCGKRYKSEPELRNHKIYHRNPEDWKFGCEICGKRFPIRSSLTTHLGTHSEEKSYKCEYCGESWKVRQTLKKHLMQKHGLKK